MSPPTLRPRRTSAKQESYDTFVKSFPAPFDPLRPITNTPSSGGFHKFLEVK